MNASHEMLFLVAKEYLELTYLQRFNIGIRLNLVQFGGICRTEKAVDEMIFTNAYKHNMLSLLVKEIERVKNE